MKSGVEIIEFKPQYHDQVIDLVLHVQRTEFNVPITLNDQPDLQKIESFYQLKNGNFWIAVDSGIVVGTIALLDVGERVGALRKMFVNEKYRGKEIGVGQALINTLLQWANSHNFLQVYLGTTESMRAAMRFYEKNGFELVEKTQLPAIFPIMKVDTIFYLKNLSTPEI